ncbi:MAG TPA: cupin domain-containing protein [Steroidobacteraceae bacterium]|nr:cupin domain-containing protein [Steroidobacteraceae bacterium]
MSKTIDSNAAPTTVGSRYPTPYDEPCQARFRRRLGDAAGLTQFGVNMTTLPPGCWSSQRHWHTAEDEFVFVLEGEIVLVTNAGEEILRAGSCAGFKAGAADGHQLQNRSDRDAVVLEIGTRRPEDDEVFYPDIDLRLKQGRSGFMRGNGEPYTGR